MALSPSLQQFKSSGVYRLEFDKSQITNIPSETIRLVIGFSKKGPFNTPVFVQDSTFFRTVFGDVDTTLERKGSFFHRTALTCLDRGPIIVLNLLNLDNTLDTSEFASVSTSATDANSAVASAPVSSYFNTDKFWFTDPNALIDAASNIDNQSVTAQRLLNFANVGRKSISVLTRKSDITGFDVIAKDWYGVGKVPTFMNENDYISDFMIDVIIVEGDFSNYSTLSLDPIFGSYFDSTGLVKNYTDSYGNTTDGITAFLSLSQVNVLGVYTGSIVPEFQDKNGNNIFIQDLINLETSKTGLLMAINQAAFDDQPSTEIGGVSRYISGDLIDTVGHTIESQSPSVLNFLSYYGSVIDTYTFAALKGATGVTGSGSLYNNLIVGATSSVAANALLTASASLTGGTAWTPGYYDTVTIYGPSSSALTGSLTSAFSTQAQFTAFASKINVGNSFIRSSSVGSPASTINYTHVSSKVLDTTTNTLTIKIANVLDSTSTLTGPTSTSLGWFYVAATGVTANSGATTISIIASNDWVFNYSASGSTFGVYAGVDSTIYSNNLSGILTDGDKVLIGGTNSYGYAQFTRGATNNFTSTPWSTNTVFGTESPILSKSINYLTLKAYNTNNPLTGVTSIGATTSFTVNTYTGNINEAFEIDSTLTPTTSPTNYVWLNNTSTGPLGAGGFTGLVVKGQYLVQNFGDANTGATTLSPTTGKSRLTRIISVVQDSNPLSSTYGFIKVTTNDPIFIANNNGTYDIERYQDIRNFMDHYRFSTLEGYTLRDAQMPNSTAARQNEILDVMYNTNISQALSDREVITFRYIIDSFEGLIEPATKVRLTKLAKSQQSSLAICNMPSVKQFKESTNPLFKLSSTSSFDTQYIPSGGNLNLNPSNIFNLPGIADGSNYAAFYGPYLVIREGGRNVQVPPAAHVSNLFIDKYNLALPYSIVAGPRRGVVTGTGLVGLEYNFDRTDLDFIEPFGYNAIVNKKGYGLVINANQTAQQTVKSALSQVHVRELIIYIQDGIEAILKNYRWEFNTAQNRLEIKTLADNFLSQILSDGGVYDFDNIMDSTNNTNEVIDNNIGILDTYIEPVRGMGVLVHRTTILKTGTISTGNYI